MKNPLVIGYSSQFCYIKYDLGLLDRQCSNLLLY